MIWAHIVAEGLCEEIDGKGCPYGFRRPGAPCLSAAEGESLCPHLGWSDSSEREAALWVPLWMILVDRIKARLGRDPGWPDFGRVYGMGQGLDIVRNGEREDGAN